LPVPAPLHPALPPQVRGQAPEALRAALYASSLVFTEVPRRRGVLGTSAGRGSATLWAGVAALVAEESGKLGPASGVALHDAGLRL
jgi:hypothetical protein